MKAAMNSHVAQQRHVMFQSSAENVKNRLSIMLKELEVHMNDKADEVYIAMRRDYNSVLGGGEVPRSGEMLPKTQRLARKEMMRVIDSVEMVFKKVAGLAMEDGEGKKQEEDDEEEVKYASHNSGDENGGRIVGKIEEDEDTRETTPSWQFADREQTKRESSPEEPMQNAGTDSDSESETKSETKSESDEA